VEERQDPYAPPEAAIGSTATIERHTRLGLASLVLAGISVLAILGYFVGFGFAMVHLSSPEDLAPWMPVALLLIGGSIGASLLGLALGIAGLSRTTRRRATAVIGTLIHLGILFVYGALFLFGIVVGSQIAR
jgi:hypothetical protein